MSPLPAFDLSRGNPFELARQADSVGPADLAFPPAPSLLLAPHRQSLAAASAASIPPVEGRALGAADLPVPLPLPSTHALELSDSLFSGVSPGQMSGAQAVSLGGMLFVPWQCLQGWSLGQALCKLAVLSGQPLISDRTINSQESACPVALC